MQKDNADMGELTTEGYIRSDILNAANRAGKIGAHIAPSLSIVEICTAILKVFDADQDTFVLSKAHAALGYYAAMYRFGMITREQFDSFEKDGGEFPGQPSRTENNHVDYSGGSLGMGLSYAAGKAYVLRDSKAYVVLGDGELDEGSNWEAASVIARNHIDNVIAVVDCNGLQSDGKCTDIQNKDLQRLWEAHGWKVVSCSGHDTDALIKAITEDSGDRPLAVLARTIKGKGVSFMEDNNEWHHHELKADMLEEALSEVKARYGL